MRLKGKIMLGGIFIVIFSMTISTLIISLIISRKNREGAIRNLQQAFVVIQDDINNRQREFVTQTVRIARRKQIGDVVKYFREKKLNPEMIILSENQNKHLALALYEEGLMRNLLQIAIYDGDGDLVACTVIKGKEAFIGFSRGLNKGPSFKMASIKIGETPSPNTWKPVKRIPGIESAVKKDDIPAEKVFEFSPVDNMMYMVSFAPVVASRYVTNGDEVNKVKIKAGFIRSSKVIDHSTVKRLSVLTGTDINLFVRNRLSTGMRSDYKVIGSHVFKRFTERAAGKYNGQGKPVIVDSHIGKEDFFEGILPFFSNGKYVGAISALYPKKLFHENTSHMIKTFSLVSLVCVLIVLPFTLLFAISVIRPIKKAIKVFEKIAGGDLAERIEVKSRDELGSLARSLNTTVNGLAKLIRKNQESAEELSSASIEIESSVSEQSAAASQQVSSIQEISSTVQEMASSSGQMAENAAVVVLASENTLTSVGEANGMVEDFARGMEEIKESARLTSKKILNLGEKSQAIGDILEIIKDVTNQTNLLALNASIEAAKAGEAGKGFSIVAVEIKKLAEDVAESTKEIKDIVSEIQGAVNSVVMAMEKEGKNIGEGARLALVAKGMLNEINEMAQDSTRAAQQIGEAIKQQDAATQEVSMSVQEMAEGINQSAVGNARIKESLTHLSEISNIINRAISQFKVKTD
ncbi:MAG: methyl-accepting chemotaxis protein [Thermodesulfobacteriota bacterium]|nr:methyl-accepting chemotaxis protein [Thermodesulfobacteriota bacterium]